MTSRMSESADEGQRGGDQSRAASPVIGAQGCREDAGLRLAIASTREPGFLQGLSKYTQAAVLAGNIFKRARKWKMYEQLILLGFYLLMK